MQRKGMRANKSKIFGMRSKHLRRSQQIRVREVRGTNDKSSRAFIKKETTRKGGFIKEIGLNMEVAKVKTEEPGCGQMGMVRG